MAESAPAATQGGTITLKLVRSVIGTTQRQRDTVRSLGLRKLHQTVTREDNAVTRGMLDRVRHLVQVVHADGDTGR